MPFQVNRWMCGYCMKRSYANKGSAVRHEKLCIQNPDNRTCATCVYDHGCSLRGGTSFVRACGAHKTTEELMEG